MALFTHDRSYDDQRRDMVENQLKSRGITDPLVLEAMLRTPRELFIPPHARHESYKDGPLPIGEGQTISQPYMVALMTQCLSIGQGDKILEIGTGSGYQMAILLNITSRVYSIERLFHLAERASETLDQLGYKDAFIKIGDGSCGWPEEAPFDGILVTSAAPSVPDPLTAQLADGGRLVIPIGSRHTQNLHVIVREGRHYHSQEHTACVFVPLIGTYGWSE